MIATHPLDLLPNMVRKGPATSPDDQRVAKAVKLWKSSPTLTVTQVMLASEFTSTDAYTHKKRMWIMRRMPNGRKVQQSTSDNSNPSPPLRNVSKESSNPCHPAPKIVRKRKSISDAQAERVPKKTASTHAKKAHKQATLLYAREQKKEGGLSAKKVREIILKDYEVVPSIRSIQRYVKEGLAGQSPMKKGPEKKCRRLCSRQCAMHFLP